MKERSARSLQEAMAVLLKDFGLDSRLQQYRVLEEWPAIVGEHIARVASAERIDNGKLIVRVSSSSWRQELVFLKKELIAKINNAFHKEIVNDIIFR
jgi:predicted nucleic acid-binding Zn ribbon protein